MLIGVVPPERQNGACDALEVSSSRGPLRGNVGQSDRLVMPVIEEVTIARVGPYWVEMGITRSDGRDGSTLRNQLRSVIAGTSQRRGHQSQGPGEAIDPACARRN